MSLEEAIIEKVRHLSRAKQEKLLQFADALEHEGASRNVASHARKAEMHWVARNRSAFANQWVAVEDDRLIASGLDAQKVFDAAKANGIKSPFVVRILPEDSLPFVAGW